MSESARRPDHAASHAFPHSSTDGIAPPKAPPQAPSITPEERTARRFAAASNNKSASRSTACRCCSTVSGTRRGGSNLISGVFFGNHLRDRQRSQGQTRSKDGSARPNPPTKEKPTLRPRSDGRRNGLLHRQALLTLKKSQTSGQNLRNLSKRPRRVGRVSAACQRRGRCGGGSSTSAVRPRREVAVH